MTAPTAVVGTGTTGPSDDERLGALLVAGGLLTEEALERALGARSERGHGLTRVLIEDDLVTESDLVATLASHLKLEYVDLSDYPVDAAAARLVSDSLARRYLALPIGWIEGRLIVAMADPSNVFAVDDIRTVTGAELRIAVATKQSILEAIGKHHRMMSDAENVSAEASSTFESETDLSLKAASYRVPSWDVDGMDVLAVEDAARHAAEAVRAGGGPHFLELRTYRFRAHSMYDPDRYRDKAEIEQWKERDPIPALIAVLRATNVLADSELDLMETEIAAELDDAISFAEAGTLEAVSDLERHVLSEPLQSAEAP